MTSTRNRSLPLSDEKFAKLWNNHAIPTKAIALYLGVTRSGVSCRAMSLGLAPRTKLRRQVVLNYDLFAHLWAERVSAEDIAKHFGLKSPACVRALRHARGLPKRMKGGKGGSGGWARNTPLAAALASYGDRDSALLKLMQEDPAARRKVAPRALPDEARAA